MNFKDLETFWWIAAESRELKENVLKRRILNKDLVLFRSKDKSIVALKDQCIHRGAQLSAGFLQNGNLVCPYHGWTYSKNGQVVDIPSEQKGAPKRCQKSYQVLEQDGYIYIQFEKSERDIKPFEMPKFPGGGYQNIKLINKFEGEMLNCVENFVDIPHTTYVHPNIFRNASKCKTKITVQSDHGHVFVDYANENSDFGWFSWFLNPNREPVVHTDEYFAPNVTTVNYYFNRGHFIITSQSIPIDEDFTMVYTDLTYNYGIWNSISRPIVRWQAQKIIDQDVVILRNQHQSLKRNPMSFQNINHDLIHTSIDRVFKEFIAYHNSTDKQVRKESKSKECSFWV